MRGQNETREENKGKKILREFREYLQDFVCFGSKMDKRGKSEDERHLIIFDGSPL